MIAQRDVGVKNPSVGRSLVHRDMVFSHRVSLPSHGRDFSLEYVILLEWLSNLDATSDGAPDQKSRQAGA